MDFYANDTVQYKTPEGQQVECNVLSSNAENVKVKLTQYDKERTLKVGDEVTHKGNDMVICSVRDDGTYGISHHGRHVADGIARADLTLIEGERLVNSSTLSRGDTFFKMLMDPTIRVSLLDEIVYELL